MNEIPFVLGNPIQDMHTVLKETHPDIHLLMSGTATGGKSKTTGYADFYTSDGRQISMTYVVDTVVYPGMVLAAPEMWKMRLKVERSLNGCALKPLDLEINGLKPENFGELFQFVVKTSLTWSVTDGRVAGLYI